MTRWRDEVTENDRAAVRRLVAATGFFNAAEEDIAAELVDEALRDGKASGYEFIFVDDPEAPAELCGYACFGPLTGRLRSYDLYWIAVSPSHQGRGLGKQLIREAERRVREQGAVEMFIDTSGRAQYVPTRAFYESMGYIAHELVPDFYARGDDKVVYRKEFSRSRHP